MIIDIKVGETVLVDVEIEVDENGDFTYHVPDTIDNGDTIQQVDIETGASKPVEKAALIGAIAAHLSLLETF